MNENYCTWIGNDEFCQKDSLPGKSYCEKHYERVYITLFPEMADHILNKEQHDKSRNLQVIWEPGPGKSN